MRKGTTERLIIDNDRTRVVEHSFAPGATTGWHRHEFDYVVVPLMDGRLKVVGAGGAESFADLKAGEPYFRPAGTEHEVINDGPGDYSFIEVELK